VTHRLVGRGTDAREADDIARQPRSKPGGQKEPGVLELERLWMSFDGALAITLLWSGDQLVEADVV